MKKVTTPALLWLVMALLIMVALMTARDFNGPSDQRSSASGPVDMEPASISMGTDGVIHLRK